MNKSSPLVLVSDEYLAQREADLKAGGGGGTYDGMEARVTSLEKDVARIESRIDTMARELGDLRVQTGVLAERIAHLPSKEFIYKGIAGLVAVMVAVTALAPKLQALF